MYLEPLKAHTLWLTDTWGGTGSVKVVASQFTVAPAANNGPGTDSIILSSDGIVTAKKFVGDGSQLTGVTASLPACSSGQYLQYTSSGWTCAAVSGIDLLLVRLINIIV